MGIGSAFGHIAIFRVFRIIVAVVFGNHIYPMGLTENLPLALSLRQVYLPPLDLVPACSVYFGEALSFIFGGLPRLAFLTFAFISLHSRLERLNYSTTVLRSVGQRWVGYQG